MPQGPGKAADTNIPGYGDMETKSTTLRDSLVCAWNLPKPIATQLQLKELEETELTPG